MRRPSVWGAARVRKMESSRDRHVLSVENLSVEFATANGNIRPVRDVSFDLSPGETLGIVGESGSGKSITALAVLGLLPRAARAVSGTVRLGNHALLDLSPRELRRIRGSEIGVIFQDPMSSLNPVMRVGDQIVESIRIHQSLSRKLAKKRVHE